MTGRLRELLDAATLPWGTVASARGGDVTVYDAGGDGVVFALPEDAALVVAAVNALPALLDVADAARAYLAYTEIGRTNWREDNRRGALGPEGCALYAALGRLGEAG